jgi:hypothetical protein
MAIKELFYDNRPRVLLDPRASQRIDPRFTFTRASTGTYIDANGLMRTAAEDEPRIDHDFTTGEPKGLLLEPTTSNGLNPFWPAGSSIGTFVGDVVTNTPDVAAPDGTFTATKIVNGSGERFYNGGPSNTETWTMSIWARVGDGQTGSFGMRIFSGPSTSFSGVTDQWRRYTWTRYANTSSDGTRRYLSEVSRAALHGMSGDHSMNSTRQLQATYYMAEVVAPICCQLMRHCPRLVRFTSTLAPVLQIKTILCCL